MLGNLPVKARPNTVSLGDLGLQEWPLFVYVVPRTPFGNPGRMRVQRDALYVGSARDRACTVTARGK